LAGHEWRVRVMVPESNVEGLQFRVQGSKGLKVKGKGYRV
jgi:hypothetical protein